MDLKKPSILFLCGVLLASCMKDDELWKLVRNDPPPSSGGVFITNEGNFMYGNASLSYYDTETGEVFNDVFFNRNALPLGDVAQSMAIRDTLGYIVMNGSGKIQLIHTETFEYAGKITGLTSPRCIHFVGERKAYVTDLYARAVTIVDPLTLQITGYIDADNHLSRFYQHPTDQMVQCGGYVFTNCWSFDNKILVIDTATDMVTDSIEVLKQPTSLVRDRYGKIWTVTDGGYEGSPYGHEAPGLIRIDAETRTVERVFGFEAGDRLSEITINGAGDTLYFISRGVYRHPVLSEEEPVLFIPGPPGNYPGGYYSLGVDPASSEIYVADAIDFVQRGVVYRYLPGGQPVDTFRVGINPGSFCFRPPRCE
jgi:YVTN family beta-propeller protein